MNGDCDRLNLADLKSRLPKTIVGLMNGFPFTEPIYSRINNNNNETNMKQPELNHFWQKSTFQQVHKKKKKKKKKKAKNGIK